MEPASSEKEEGPMRHVLLMGWVVTLAVGAAGCAVLTGDGGCGGLGLDRGEVVESKGDVNKVEMADEPIAPDGLLNESPWSDAVAMSGFIRGADMAKVQTRVLATYDKTNLYVAVVCEEPNTDQLVTKTTERDGEVWTDDCVEIYVDPTNDKQGTTGYYGFFVTPTNVVYDRTEDGTWSNTSWKSGTQVVDGKGWVAEVAVPWNVFGVTPRAGHRLGLMVARSRKAGVRQYMTLVPCNDEAKDTTKYPVLELR
jgi:hypothetical protein